MEVESSEEVRSAEFHIYKDKAGEYRWRLVAANGEIIADSGEGYKQIESCRNAISLVRGAQVVEEDE